MTQMARITVLVAVAVAAAGHGFLLEVALVALVTLVALVANQVVVAVAAVATEIPLLVALHLEIRKKTKRHALRK
jgi:hypothetical protein